MKIYRKIISCFFLLVLSLSLAVSVSASTVDLELTELAVILKLDEDVAVIMPDTAEDDEIFAELGIDDPATMLALMQDLGTQALLVHDGNQIFVNKNESENTQTYFNLKTFTPAQLNEFLTDYNTDSTSLVSLAEVYMKDSMPFVEVNFTGTDDYGVGVNEYIVFTIVNGYTLALSQNSTEAIPQESIDYIRSLVDTLEFTRIDELVQEDDIVEAQAMFILFLLLTMLAVLIGSIVFIKVRKKKIKNKQRIMMADLANYRQDREEGFEKQQEIRFKNITELSDESIDIFSVFQSFIFRPLPYILSIMAVVLCLMFTVSLDSDWWFIALFGAILAFILIKFVTSAKTNAKSMKKVYKNLRSRHAVYSFYDHEFEISGIEHAEFHPYFQITDIAEHKNYFYFFFGDQNPYFVDTSGFTQGEVNEFRAFIIKKTRLKMK
ncbi:MAG: YcxB family protein [Clostridia bacterium]